MVTAAVTSIRYDLLHLNRGKTCFYTYLLQSKNKIEELYKLSLAIVGCMMYNGR